MLNILNMFIYGASIQPWIFPVHSQLLDVFYPKMFRIHMQFLQKKKERKERRSKYLFHAPEVAAAICPS